MYSLLFKNGVDIFRINFIIIVQPLSKTIYLRKYIPIKTSNLLVFVMLYLICEQNFSHIRFLKLFDDIMFFYFQSEILKSLFILQIYKLSLKKQSIRLNIFTFIGYFHLKTLHYHKITKKV